MKNYGLCPSHCLSAPALSWDAMLNMTKVKLELISDPDMYIFLEKRYERWSFLHFNRYSKANNKYLKSYDPKQKLNHIIYLDASNFNEGIQMERS